MRCHDGDHALVQKLLKMVAEGADGEEIETELMKQRTRRLKSLMADARDAALVERLEKRHWR